MRRHGLFEAGWRFRFDHARRRFGCCRYGPKLITLSRPLTLLNGEPKSATRCCTRSRTR
jgi:hypothetical protein